MAPNQSLNDNLISNKVPIKLQKESEEIKDWSLQELLHHLLRAEDRVTKHEHSNTQTLPKRRVYFGKDRAECQDNKIVETQQKSKPESSKSKNGHKDNKATVEMGIKGIKYYRCHKEGHIARLCPGTNVICTGCNFSSLCEEQLCN